MLLRGYVEAGYPSPDSSIQDWLRQKEKELGVSIILERGSGRFKERGLDTGLVIYDYACATFCTRETAFGIGREGTSNYIQMGVNPRRVVASSGSRAIYPSGVTQHTIKRAGNDYTIADKGPMTLWLRYDIRNFSPANLNSILKGVLESVVVSSEEFLEQMREQQATRLKTSLETLFKDHVAKRLKGIQGTISSLEQNISSYEEQLTSYRRELDHKFVELQSVAQITNDDETKIMEEIEKLIASESFENFEAGTDYNGYPTLDVFTRPIYLYSPDRRKRTYLGKFKIVFGLQSHTINFYNLDNERNSERYGVWQHPHTHGNAMCVGGRGSHLRNMAAEQGNLAAMLEQCIGLLETYNPADSGATPQLWWNQRSHPTEYLQSDGEYYEEGKGPHNTAKVRTKSKKSDTMKGLGTLVEKAKKTKKVTKGSNNEQVKDKDAEGAVDGSGEATTSAELV